MRSRTISSAWGTGSILSMSASVTLKSAVFAPIPSASDDTATAANPGFRSSSLVPYRRSAQNPQPIPRMWCLSPTFPN